MHFSYITQFLALDKIFTGCGNTERFSLFETIYCLFRQYSLSVFEFPLALCNFLRFLANRTGVVIWQYHES